MQITVDPELRSLIPPLRAEERRGLEDSIRAEGCRDPLVVWGDRAILLDGHNRHDICTALGLPFRTVPLDVADKDAAKLWVLTNQLARRNLTDDQRTAIALRVAEQRSRIEKQERAKKGGKTGGRHHPKVSLEDTVSSKLTDPPKERTRAAVAQEAKVPERKVKDLAAAKKAIEQTQGKKAAEQVVRDVERGNKTVREAKADARRAKRAMKKQDEFRMRAEVIGASGAGADRLWEVRQGDCLDVLEGIAHESARLIFADPPYNIGVDYGDHYDDSRPSDEFDRWCELWLAAAFRALSPDGSLWLLVNHEWARTLCFRAEDLGFHLRQWITWYETFGVNCTGKFNRCSRPLLWLAKDAGNFVFNEHVPEIRRASDRQGKYSDKRAELDGKLWDDVWGIEPAIPRIVGTGGERIPGFPTQLPLALLRPIVACASDPGDLVIDPFSGSGTTGAACIELGRRYVGIELSEAFTEMSRARLAAHEKEAVRATA